MYTSNTFKYIGDLRLLAPFSFLRLFVLRHEVAVHVHQDVSNHHLHPYVKTRKAAGHGRLVVVPLLLQLFE